MTTTKKSVATKMATGARGFGSLPKRTQWAVVCLLFASILAMLTPLLVSKITNDRSKAVWDERQVQITLQREFIADYKLQTNLAETAFANLQNQLLDKDLSETALQETMQQATLAMQSFEKLADTLNNATYLDAATLVFLHELQAQMEVLGIPQNGRESRASNAENHWLTKKVVFVTITYGYHMSPNLCAKLAGLADAGTIVGAIIDAILAALEAGGAVVAIAAAVAVQLYIYYKTFEYGASHKGVDLYYPLIGMPFPTK
ncbi:MAG: hypothetical protein FWD76_04100 [Firmicutes bacterium]|nr:hypothetical protein [Bacillota bacterium]